MKQISALAGDNSHPSWSPDGRFVVFMNNPNNAYSRLIGRVWSDQIFFDGGWNLYTMRSDGSDVIQNTTNKGDNFDPSWSKQ